MAVVSNNPLDGASTESFPDQSDHDWISHQKGGLSIKLPMSWYVADLETSENQKVIQLLKGSNPEMAGLLESVSSEQFLMRAFDLESPDMTFVQNMNVNNFPAPQDEFPGFDELLKVVAKSHKDQMNATGFTFEHAMSIGDHNAKSFQGQYALRDESGNERQISFIQYLVHDGNTLWCLTFSTLLEHRDQMRKDIEQMAKSFRVIR